MTISPRFVTLFAAMMVTVLYGSPVAAQESSDVCPQDYAIFQNYCLNARTGDVVNQHRPPDGEESARACALRDLAAWTLIERHGEAESLPPQIVAEAFFEVMKARRACRAGRSEEGLALYDRVTGWLASASR